MPERLERLQQLVDQLERELAEIEELDPQSREVLEEAAAEIRTALQSRDPEHLQENPVMARLTEAAGHFESEHPTAAAVFQRLVTGLGQMGI